jgi:hypothetical protein
MVCEIGVCAAWPVTFAKVTMGWNGIGVKPWGFDNTMDIAKGHPILHLVEWSGTVARGAPGRRLKAIVINCHGYFDRDFRGSLDSAGGIPTLRGGFGLNLGEGIKEENAYLFGKLSGLVEEVHIYACGAGDTPVGEGENMSTHMCQKIADFSRATVVASIDLQPDVESPGPNKAPAMVGKVVRFLPG